MNLMPKFISKIYSKGILVLLASLFIMVWFVFYVMDEQTLPIQQIKVSGQFKNLKPDYIEKEIRHIIRGGFFSLDMSSVQDLLIADPWIRSVSIKRVWHDSLWIILTERLPIARWGEHDLIDSEGNIFRPKTQHNLAHLPQFYGIDNSELLMLNQFNNMQSKLEHFRITQLSLDGRRSWSLVLDDRITVILGRQNTATKFNDFLALALIALQDQLTNVASVDMRYTNGFSVKFHDANYVAAVKENDE